MLRQIEALQSAIAALPDIDNLLRRRLVAVADALTVYRGFLLSADQLRKAVAQFHGPAKLHRSAGRRSEDR